MFKQVFIDPLDHVCQHYAYSLLMIIGSQLSGYRSLNWGSNESWKFEKRSKYTVYTNCYLNWSDMYSF